MRQYSYRSNLALPSPHTSPSYPIRPSQEELESHYEKFGQTVYDMSSKNAWLKIHKKDKHDIFVQIFGAFYRFPAQGYSEERILRFLHKALDDIVTPSPGVREIQPNPINSILLVVDHDLLFGYNVHGELENCSHDHINFGYKRSVRVLLETSAKRFQLPLQDYFVSCWVDAPLCLIINSTQDTSNLQLKPACERANGIETVNEMFKPFEFILQKPEHNFPERNILYLVNVGGHYVCVSYNDNETYNYYDPFTGRALLCKNYRDYFLVKEHYLLNTVKVSGKRLRETAGSSNSTMSMGNLIRALDDSDSDDDTPVYRHGA